jgi:Cu-processing system permease protein
VLDSSPRMQAPAIEAAGLVKTYAGPFGGRPQRALAGLDLTVPIGHAFGLIGPNGAGKTTFIKLLLAMLAAAYGASGFCLLLGIKTDVWTFRPILAALLMTVSFATIYAAMLLAALLVRSAALSAAVGSAVYLLGIVAGVRDGILSAWNEGLVRALFAGATLFLPRISALGRMAADIAGARPVPMTALATMVLGLLLFVLATLALAAWVFERKDY